MDTGQNQHHLQISIFLNIAWFASILFAGSGIGELGILNGIPCLVVELLIIRYALYVLHKRALKRLKFKKEQETNYKLNMDIASIGQGE